MAPNIVVAAMQAAPDALGSYRKNRVMDRTRKGNDYLFHAVELVDGIRELLDVEAVSGFSIRYNGCEELRQLIEQTSASTKGVGYVAKRYLQAAEELLEFSKLCVARAKAKAVVRGSYMPSPSPEAGPSTPRAQYTSSPAHSLRSRTPTPDLTPDTDNHSSTSTLDLPRFASPAPTSGSHPSTFGGSRSNSFFSQTRSRSNSFDRNSFFLNPRSTTPGRQRLVSTPSRVLGRLTPSLPGPLAGPTQRTRNVSIRQAPEAVAHACRVLDAKHHFPGVAAVAEEPLHGTVRSRKDSVHLREAAMHRPDSAIVDDREEEEDEDPDVPTIHVVFPTESSITPTNTHMHTHTREAAAGTHSPQSQAASLTPPPSTARIHAREAAVHRPDSLAQSALSSASSSYTTCSTSPHSPPANGADDDALSDHEDNHSVRSVGSSASFSTRTHRLSTTAMPSIAGDDDDDEDEDGDRWSEASTVATATLEAPVTDNNLLGVSGPGTNSAVSIPSIPDELERMSNAPSSPMDTVLSVPSNPPQIPNQEDEDEEEDDAQLPPDTEVEYYCFPLASRSSGTRTPRSLPISGKRGTGASLELVPALSPATVAASGREGRASRGTGHGQSASVPNADEFGRWGTPAPSMSTSAMRRLASESAPSAAASPRLSPGTSHISGPAMSPALGAAPGLSPAVKNRKLPPTPSIRERFLIDGDSVAGSRVASFAPSTLVLGSAGWSAAPSAAGWASRAPSASPKSEAGMAGVGSGVRSGTPSTILSASPGMSRVESEANRSTVITSTGSSGSGGTFGARLTAPSPLALGSWSSTPRILSSSSSSLTPPITATNTPICGREGERERTISNTSDVPTIASMPFTPTSPGGFASGTHPARASSPTPTITPTIASEGSFGPIGGGGEGASRLSAFGPADPPRAGWVDQRPEVVIVAPVGVRPARIGGEAWWASKGVVGV